MGAGGGVGGASVGSGGDAGGKAGVDCVRPLRSFTGEHQTPMSVAELTTAAPSSHQPPPSPVHSRVFRTAPMLTRAVGVEGQFPVPLHELAEYLGYKLFDFDTSIATNFANVSGIIDYRAKKIYLNAHDSLARRHFTLAHEIAHACLHAGGPNTVETDMRDMFESASGQKVKEIQANYFAADLLMPVQIFARKWVDYKGDVARLAEFFVVSSTAVNIRIQSLGINQN
jgi:Zn-dependent peptidase ImmA (M78 family)